MAKTPCETCPTFFIVTPSLNAADTIDQTIRSIITLAGDFSIRYHIQDGGSTDGTIDKLKQWEAALCLQNPIVQCQRVKFTWASEPDQGMYDAITKGFDNLLIFPDNFITWINADDILLPDALSTLSRIASDHPHIQWVGGPQYVIENDAPILKRDLPTPTAIIREGLCDGHHWHFLQQEGMFFKKRLWFKGRHALRGFKLAGDWSLWREFARHAEYYQFYKPLGAFRKRDGQLSIERFDDYKAEIDGAISNEVRHKALCKLYSEKERYNCSLIKTDASDTKILIDQQTTADSFDFFWDNISK
jgi:glycosyltransferase involved in cell wall biosynthesis